MPSASSLLITNFNKSACLSACPSTDRQKSRKLSKARNLRWWESKRQVTRSDRQYRVRRSATSSQSSQSNKKTSQPGNQAAGRKPTNSDVSSLQGYKETSKQQNLTQLQNVCKRHHSGSCRLKINQNCHPSFLNWHAHNLDFKCVNWIQIKQNQSNRNDNESNSAILSCLVETFNIVVFVVIKW